MDSPDAAGTMPAGPKNHTAGTKFSLKAMSGLPERPDPPEAIRWA
jgi:hypothetical protein